MILDIVTAEKMVFSEEVDLLVAPGVDGELGILNNHAPLLTILKPGDIKVVKDDMVTHIAVSGGFMEVMPDKVIILADTAERADEIDEDRAEQALERARERVADTVDKLELGRALASLRRSQVRLKVARRRRSVSSLGS